MLFRIDCILKEEDKGATEPIFKNSRRSPRNLQTDNERFITSNLLLQLKRTILIITQH